MDLTELVALCKNKNISDVVLETEALELKKTPQEILEMMEQRYVIMQQSVIQGMNTKAPSISNLSGYNAMLLKESVHAPLLGELGKNAMVMAMAVAEQNARMGKIVAAPTAGSCGILPAVLFSAAKEYNISEKNQIMALLTASQIGKVIAEKATLSGAEGGCQAECGSASAMAAAACVEMLGGTPQMCINAVALAFKFIMGLVCDPVAGLVEVPCIKRNASGAINALCAATLSLSGIKSVIPADEVIDAMNVIGKSMDCSLKETSKSGLAATPTAKRIENNL